jgi:hypothetical protein
VATLLATLLFVAPVGAKYSGSKGDGDKMPSGWERRNGLSTRKNDARRDPDSDVLRNIQEFVEGTDPRNDDTDDDGVTDGQEVEEGTDPTDAEDDGEDVDEEEDAGTEEDGVSEDDADEGDAGEGDEDGASDAALA